jgi:hypothetical protein
MVANGQRATSDPGVRSGTSQLDPQVCLKLGTRVKVGSVSST